MQTLNYHPAFQHPTIKAVFLVTVIFSFLDLMIFITTIKYYGYGSPVEMHIFPVTSILFSGWTAELKLKNKKIITHKLFGLKLISTSFNDLKLRQNGVYVSLEGASGYMRKKTIFCYKKELSANLNSFLTSKS